MEPPSASSSRPDRLDGRRLAAFFGVALVVVVLDQLTKAGIRGWLQRGETWPEGWELIRLAHVHNTGAAFGILQGASTLLIVVTLVAIAAITFFLLTLPSHTRWYRVALSGILGGAIGNLIDRVRLGHVTDFIDPTHYPAFNVADSAIFLGVVGIAIISFFAPGDLEPREEAASPASTTPSDEVRT